MVGVWAVGGALSEERATALQKLISRNMNVRQVLPLVGRTDPRSRSPGIGALGGQLPPVRGVVSRAPASSPLVPLPLVTVPRVGLPVQVVSLRPEPSPFVFPPPPALAPASVSALGLPVAALASTLPVRQPGAPPFFVSQVGPGDGRQIIEYEVWPVSLSLLTNGNSVSPVRAGPFPGPVLIAGVDLFTGQLGTGIGVHCWLRLDFSETPELQDFTFNAAGIPTGGAADGVSLFAQGGFGDDSGGLATQSSNGGWWQWIGPSAGGGSHMCNFVCAKLVSLSQVYLKLYAQTDEASDRAVAGLITLKLLSSRVPFGGREGIVRSYDLRHPAPTRVGRG
jgi:hypothetical protein